MVLVVGATGLLGLEICRQLRGQDRPVRAFVRTSSDPAKIAALEALGCAIAVGDLKDPASLAAACRGVQAVISTASSTFSRAEGDSIQTVDHDGQLSLIDAAEAAGVQRFVLISFPDTARYPNPLNAAKRAAEARLEASAMDYVSLRANYFMEIWLSPALGFDYANQTARVYGDGNAPLNLISYRDVAKTAVACLDAQAPHNAAVVVDGPEPVSQWEAIRMFETVGGVGFTVEQVPDFVLEEQHAGADDPLGKSFAGLILVYAHGLPTDEVNAARELEIPLTGVEAYAREVLGKG
jgi:uncharacterized protein YbjT (DUF2867 family)